MAARISKAGAKKSPAIRKSVKKKVAGKKAAGKSAKKVAGKKSVKKKVAGKKATKRENSASRGKVVEKKSGAEESLKASSGSGGKTAKRKTKVKSLRKNELNDLRKGLLALRDRLTGQVAALQGASLESQDWVNLEEDGTNAFDRQFALNLASSEEDCLFEIDEALRRMDEGKYGICDGCGGSIEKPRLKALPFAKMCITCKSEQEKMDRMQNGRVGR